MKNQIEFVIPKGYKKSDKSTDEKLVFELVEEKDIEKEKRDFLFDIFNRMCFLIYYLIYIIGIL